MMKNLYDKLPKSPGVYVMKDAHDKILYIGKAGNLKRRVSSYFTRPLLRRGSGGQAHDYRIERLLKQIQKISYKKTDTALEALILESELIKEYHPPYNVREKDDKSFLYVEITREKFPRVLLVRGKNRSEGERYGPFTSASSIREALRILRRIFPWSIHNPEDLGKFRRGCFDYQIGLCPGTCIGAVSQSDYQKNIRNLKLFLRGKKMRIIKSLAREMTAMSRGLEFEKAEALRRQIFALQHIQDIALISDEKFQFPNDKFPMSMRIEGYDISNISGTSAVGSMVVFRGEEPTKSEYRKFKIRTVKHTDDVGMLKEVLRRRFRHWSPSRPVKLADGHPIARSDLGWPLPALILIDGGKGQMNAVKSILEEFGLKIPVVGIAKGPRRKKNEFFGMMPQGVTEKTLIKVRNEAHRFALSYHKKLRHISFLGTHV